MTTMVRVDCTRGFTDLVKRLGGNPEALWAGAGLEPDLLSQPSAYIPHRALAHLLERAAHQLDCSDFGLRLAADQDIGVLGPMAVAVRNAPTVGDALQCAAKYLYTHAPAVQLSLHPEAGASRTTVRLDLLLDALPVRRQALEAHVGLLHRVLAMLSNGRMRPVAVCFRHAAGAATTAHFRFFGAPVRFQAAEDGLIVAADDLLLPIEGHDRQLQEFAARFLETNYPPPSARLAERVRLVVERLLQAGRCTRDEAATALGMPVKTFQRRLQDEAADFESIRDEVRRELALRYLELGDLPLTQISALLGYSEPSAFTRSCRRWFGRSPRQLRAAPRTRAA